MMNFLKRLFWERLKPVAYADKIAFESAMRSGKGCDVWPTAGDYEQRTGRKLLPLYTRPEPPKSKIRFESNVRNALAQVPLPEPRRVPPMPPVPPVRKEAVLPSHRYPYGRETLRLDRVSDRDEAFNLAAAGLTLYALSRDIHAAPAPTPDAGICGSPSPNGSDS